MDKRIGSYRVLEEVAIGGHATVYRVWDTRTSRTMALKVLHPHLSRDPAYLNRFEREANMTSSVHHPNIVRIFEVGKVKDSHFISMEYLPMTLHHLLRGQVQLPIHRAMDIAHQVCLGLDAAAQQGIVHRDIKPQNVLLGTEGTVKITDFGIARAQELATMTRTGLVMGTPHYMAPEQARGEAPDVRSDIYSVGVLLYQMLAGRVPFEGDNPWEVIRQHVEEPPASVRAFHSEVPEELAAVVERCLRKNPADRFEAPLELAEAIESLEPSVGQSPFDNLGEIIASLPEGGIQAPATASLPASGVAGWWGPVQRRWPFALAALGAALVIVLFPAGGLSGLNSLFGPEETPTPAPLATSTPPPRPTPVFTATPPPSASPLPTSSPTTTPPTATPVPVPSPLPVVPQSITKEIRPISPGEAATVSLTPEEVNQVGVSQVRISAARSIRDAVIVLERLDRPPVPSQPPGHVFSYIDISILGSDAVRVSGATISFTVPSSWLSENDVDPGGVALYNFQSEWTALPTLVDSRDGDILVYSARTPGFSVFAVAGAERQPTPTPGPTPSPTPPPSPTPTPTPSPTLTPTPAPTPSEDALLLQHVGTGPTTTPPFTLNSSPWKLQYRTSWSGPVALELVSETGVSRLAEHEAREGVLYETFVYEAVGASAIGVPIAPPGAEWTVWVTANPTSPPPGSLFGPPGTVFAYAGTSHAKTPTFSIASSPWKLRFQTTWDGAFALAAVAPGGAETPLFDGPVSAGVVYETFLYGVTGDMYLSSTVAPPAGRWVAWAVQDPPLPVVSPEGRERGLVFTHTGTGRVNSPPFQADFSPWRLVYTTSWSGPLTLSANGVDGVQTLVEQEVAAGIIYETYIYGLLEAAYLSVGEAPSAGAWSVSITQNPDRLPVSVPGGPPEAIFGYSGTGNASTPEFQVQDPVWRLVYRASWSGELAITSGGRTLVAGDVTSGEMQEITVSGLTGAVHLTLEGVPPDGVWAVWVVGESGNS